MPRAWSAVESGRLSRRRRSRDGRFSGSAVVRSRPLCTTATDERRGGVGSVLSHLACGRSLCRAWDLAIAKSHRPPHPRRSCAHHGRRSHHQADYAGASCPDDIFGKDNTRTTPASAQPERCLLIPGTSIGSSERRTMAVGCRLSGEPRVRITAAPVASSLPHAGYFSPARRQCGMSAMI